MMALGSLEYQFPLTASDTFQQVIFTDFGTVEGDYNFHKIRVSIGTGIRMLIPQMGPDSPRFRPRLPDLLRRRRPSSLLQLQHERDVLERFSIAWMPNLRNAEALEEPPCVPPSQGGKKDQTPPTFPPLQGGVGG